MYLFLTIGAALAFTVGGIFMKLSEGMARLVPTLLVFGFFAVGAGLQTFALRHAELGIAYLLVLGLESILAFLFGVYFFGEGYSIAKLLGMAAIATGIMLLHL
jgi:small multidrug resistance pump/quaternary ammonium compound-resistance protein SugE